MPTSPAEMMAAIIRNLPQKTGKDIQEWKAITRSEAVAAHKSHKEMIAYLQREYGLGHGQAQTIIWEAEKPHDYVPPGDEQRRLTAGGPPNDVARSSSWDPARNRAGSQLLCPPSVVGPCGGGRQEMRAAGRKPSTGARSRAPPPGGRPR